MAVRKFTARYGQSAPHRNWMTKLKAAVSVTVRLTELDGDCGNLQGWFSGKSHGSRKNGHVWRQAFLRQRYTILLDKKCIESGRKMTTKCH